MAFPLLGIEFLVIEKITNAYILVIVKKNLKFSYLSWRAIYILISMDFFFFFENSKSLEHVWQRFYKII